MVGVVPASTCRTCDRRVSGEIVTWFIAFVLFIQVMRRPRTIIRLIFLTLSSLIAWPQHVCAHGSYHDVVDALTKEITARPDDAALYVKRATAHVEHEEWQPALIDLEKADRLAPGTLQTDYLRGKALVCGKQFAMAQTVLDAFLQKHPEDAPALTQRAKAANGLGDHATALTDYRKALALNPQAEPGQFQEVAAALHSQHFTLEAVEVLRRGLTQHGDNPAPLMLALDMELAAKDFDAALLRVEAMKKSAPRPEPWMARRAQVLALANRDAEAKAAWTSLRDHLMALPNLERGMPMLSQLLAEAQQALGVATPAPVIAPPLSSPVSIKQPKKT